VTVARAGDTLETILKVYAHKFDKAKHEQRGEAGGGNNHPARLRPVQILSTARLRPREGLSLCRNPCPRLKPTPGLEPGTLRYE